MRRRKKRDCSWRRRDEGLFVKGKEEYGEGRKFVYGKGGRERCLSEEDEGER